MNAMFRTRIALSILLLIALALLVSWGSALTQSGQPPPQVQGQAFSISAGSPSTSSGVHPADILGVGGYPLIPCENLGLLCTDASGVKDDIKALSYGWDFVDTGLPDWQFSVARGSRGAGGSAVRAEADCTPAQALGDVFETPRDASNNQDLDGDGVACSTNQGYGLSLAEGSTADELDAVERDPCLIIDPDCNGIPDEALFFVLEDNSPTLVLLGASAADILVSGNDYLPQVWATVAQLGLVTGDRIDGLCLYENGSGSFDSGDKVLLSLAAGSPSLTRLGASAADLLRPAPLRRVYRYSALGLESADDVDGMLCSVETGFFDLFMPFLR